MADPNWLRLLKELYENPAIVYKPSDGRLEYDFYFDDPLPDIDEEDKQMAFSVLESRGLIEKHETAEVMRLTPLGVEIAHDREVASRQHWINKIVAMVTVGLIYAAIVQSAAAYEAVPGFSLGLAGVMVGAGVVAMGIILLINFYL